MGSDPNDRNSQDLTPLRVARIPFLNCDPFYLGWDATVIELVSATPRELGHLAAQGLLDAGPMAVSDYFRLEGSFEPLAPWGIAVGEIAESVLLFSQEPLPMLDGKTIGVTDESATSVELLKLILEQRYRVIPRRYRTQRPPAGEAILLIGDEALRTVTVPSPLWSSHPFLYDLGTEWWEWQQLPFVFAVWVVRRDLPQTVKAALAEQLGHSVAQFWQDPARHLQSRCGQFTIPMERLIQYLGRMRYRLDPEDSQGMDRFRTLSVVELVSGLARGYE